MEDAIKKIRNVAHHNKWIGFAEDQVFAVLCIVKPIEEAVAGGESVIASQTIHLLLCGRLRSLRRIAFCSRREAAALFVPGCDCSPSSPAAASHPESQGMAIPV